MLRPDEVADHAFRAVEENRFYVFTDPEYEPRIRTHLEDVIHGRNPAPLTR